MYIGDSIELKTVIAQRRNETYTTEYSRASSTTGTPATSTTSTCGNELVIFKPEFSGKPEEDPEEHLLRIIAWMNRHNFKVGHRIRRFPSTLAR